VSEVLEVPPEPSEVVPEVPVAPEPPEVVLPVSRMWNGSASTY
jgi:hypothetical protein